MYKFAAGVLTGMLMSGVTLEDFKTFNFGPWRTDASAAASEKRGPVDEATWDAAEAWAREVIADVRATREAGKSATVYEVHMATGKPYVDIDGVETQLTQDQFEALTYVLIEKNKKRLGITEIEKVGLDGFNRITIGGVEKIMSWTELGPLLYADSVFSFNRPTEETDP
jgi:hypothetical protein